jgi:hypothetical protein
LASLSVIGLSSMTLSVSAAPAPETGAAESGPCSGSLASLEIALSRLAAEYAATPHAADAPSVEEAPSNEAREAEVPASDARKSDASTRSWQIGVALSAISRQRASFDVEPLNSGRSFPGTLDRTSYGPSGGSVLIEPGYVIANRFVVGMLLDIGTGLTELKVKELNFSESQSIGSFAVGPRLAYYFADSGWLQPFASIAFGYTKTPSKLAAQTLRITEYQGFLGLGVSVFPTPSFSIDSSVRGAYGVGSGYVDSPPLEDASLSGSVVTFLWTIGTSGWLK